MRNSAPARICRKVMREIRGNEWWARSQGVSIGQGCRILSNVVSSEPWLISIGDRTTISTGVLLITHDGSGWLYRDNRGRRHRIGQIVIGSDVFIGAQSTILPGTKIGDRVVVGAGSVVNRSVPDGFVVSGNPARIVSSYDEYMAKVSAWPADGDKVGDSRRARLDSIAMTSFRPDLAP